MPSSMSQFLYSLERIAWSSTNKYLFARCARLRPASLLLQRVSVAAIMVAPSRQTLLPRPVVRSAPCRCKPPCAPAPLRFSHLLALHWLPPVVHQACTPRPVPASRLAWDRGGSLQIEAPTIEPTVEPRPERRSFASHAYCAACLAEPGGSVEVEIATGVHSVVQVNVFALNTWARCVAHGACDHAYF